MKTEREMFEEWIGIPEYIFYSDFLECYLPDGDMPKRLVLSEINTAWEAWKARAAIANGEEI